MLLGVSENIELFQAVEVNSLKEVAQRKLKSNVTPGIFKNNKREINSFLQADFLILDFDGTMSLKHAQTQLDTYDFSYIIAPSRSHLVKPGLICSDRFHVIIPFETRIENQADYYATYKEAQKLFPQSDPQCKDPARYYYPSKEIAVIKEAGKFFPVIKAVEKPKGEAQIIQLPKKVLRPETMDFLLRGCSEGGRNGALFKAATDAREKGYSQEEFIELLDDAQARLAIWTDQEYENAEILKTIESAFKDEYAEKKPYTNTFNIMSIKQVYESNEELDWLVNGFLTAGGISVFAGPPKAGKSTLVRQLCKAVCRGQPFLTRDCKRGKVLYLALEEQASLLREQYQKLDLTEHDEFYLHIGPITGQSTHADFEAVILDLKPSLVVIDTMMLFTKVEDKNYAANNDAIEKLRNIARTTGTHILMIHHSNKNPEAEGANAILGSVAIQGAVDCIILFKETGNPQTRYLDSKQRGGKPFSKLMLTFNEDNLEYYLDTRSMDKAKVQDDF